MEKNAKRIIPAILLLLAILFACNLPSHAQDLNQLTVTIRASSKPLHSILDDLTEQTNYNFTFDSRLIDSRMRIDMNLKEVPLPLALDTLFQNPDLSYRVINQNIVIYPLKRQRALVSDTIRKTRPLLEIHGTIFDGKTGKPLPYATIGVLDTYFGTISNGDGNFLLRLPDTLQQPILVSSFIGYKNQYTPISFSSNEQVQISMNRNIISLQEVIIRYQDPAALLRSSVARIGENYLNIPSGMQAYYREAVTKEDKYMIFSEAVVEIAKPPYQNLFEQEKSRLLKGRKLTNIALEDTVVFKIRSGLNSLLQLDIIKYLPEFLSEDFELIYDLQFSDVVAFRDRLVYVISFRQKEYIDEILFRGEIYIDRESLAILAADFEYDPYRLRQEEDMFVTRKSRGVRIRPMSASYHVEYAQTDGKYRLSQVQGKVKFKVRKRRQWVSSSYQINLEMAVTKVNPGNPPRIRMGEQMKMSTVMSDQDFEYDPEFWGGYNTISPEADLTESLRRIEKSMLEINE